MQVNDILVSIRMPKALIAKLKDLAKLNHYLDLSEEVRSIVKQKYFFYNESEIFQLKKLRENIETEIRQKSQRKVHEEVANELEKIKFQLKKEGYTNE
jgi:Arc/MetJ-type ribon-helix-helix transcriptional regulator